MKKLLRTIALLSITSLVYATNHNTKSATGNPTTNSKSSVDQQLAKLEAGFNGKIGVYAINTFNNEVIQYRANERFPVQSTLKLIGVAALLKHNESNINGLQEKIHYTKKDLMYWHPVTGINLANGMTLEEFGEAAVSYSDNPAMNLILKKYGGPQFATEFARSIGNKTFNVEHYEGEMNSDPKNIQDTSTPKDMAISVQKLTLGNVLTPTLRAKLVTWLKNDTVGYKRIRAGVPGGWIVADKTGSGDYGVANDVGVMWSPACKPVVLAIYTVQNNPKAKNRDDIVASTTSIVFNELAKHNNCFNAPF